jgi:hypothetical protein
VKMFTNVGCEVKVQNVSTLHHTADIVLPNGNTVTGKIEEMHSRGIRFRLDPDTKATLYYRLVDCPDSGE